jgi:hypothetical protein
MNKITELENVFFENKNVDNSCESDFLISALIELRKIMISEFDDYIFFIFSSQEKNIVPESAHIQIAKKKVLIFVSDESYNDPCYLASYYYIIFKMYLKTDRLLTNIYSFPLSPEKKVPQLPVVPMGERKYSVFFSGNLNNSRIELYLSLLLKITINKVVNANRRFFVFLTKLKIFRRLVKKPLKRLVLLLKSEFAKSFPYSYIRFVDGFMQGLPPWEYGEIIANSKIVLCPKGYHSAECFRHYEAMRAGCVIISGKLPPTHIYKNSPVIQVDNWIEGLAIASDLLNNADKLEEIGRLTYDWWEKRCSENATAQYMNECIKEMNSNSSERLFIA